MDSGEPGDEHPESETEELSGSDTNWDSGEPIDEDPESETDELLGSGTDWGSGEPEDEDPESETKEQSGLGIDWDSGASGDEDPKSETDELSALGNDWDSGKIGDKGPESDGLSRSGIDWDSGEPEDEDPESETDELSGSDTDWDYGEPEDMEPESETDEVLGSDTDRVSGEPEDEDPESEEDELSGSNTDWDSGKPEDMEPQLETDKLSLDTEWGTQKKNVDSKELVISSELNKLLKLKHINLGKHLSKKVAHLLKSRPSLLASFHKELKNASHHSSKVRDAHLRGLLKSMHGITMNANEQGPEIDDLVSNSAPEDMELQSETDNLSSDTKWGSSAPEDADPESQADKVPLSAIEWDAGSPQTREPELKHNVFSSPDIESDTAGVPGAVESKVMLPERSQLSSQDNPESVPSVEAPEQDTVKKQKLKLPTKYPNTVVMKKLLFKDKEFETKKANGLPLEIPKKSHGKNGHVNLNIRLESLGNQGVHTKKGKRKNSEKESEGAVARVLITLFVVGGLLVVLLMAACFTFAW